jgi:hypothetical protein
MHCHEVDSILRQIRTFPMHDSTTVHDSATCAHTCVSRNPSWGSSCRRRGPCCYSAARRSADERYTALKSVRLKSTDWRINTI